MPAKTVVITGATSGIGAVAACELAGRGWRVVFAARDPGRAQALLARLRAIAPDADPVAVTADLTSVSDVRRAAAEIAAAAPVIDVLANNAGAIFSPRRVTAEGLEATFALNHMAYFVLTALLLPNLRAAGAARIVSTASRAHRGQRLDFDDLQATRGYASYSVYGRSKLCNILFTRELARRLAGTGVSANCFHPGFVDTGFAQAARGPVGAAFRVAKSLIAISPQKGARTLVHLATSEAVAGVSGGYFSAGRLCTPSRAARNGADGERLWRVSARLAGFDENFSV